MATGWTQDDADAVRGAIRKIVTGDREVTVLFNSAGEQRSVTYQMAQLSDLRALLAEINHALNNGAPYRLAEIHSGLGGPTTRDPNGNPTGGFGGCR